MQEGNREKFSTTLLVIDDDSEMLAILKDFLEREGHRVIAESSGERAIATVDLEGIDAVILDKEMPGMHGFDLLSFFRRRVPDTPVILITAFGGPRVAEEAFRRGAARYLEKPFRMADLLGAIRTVIKVDERVAPSEESVTVRGAIEPKATSGRHEPPAGGRGRPSEDEGLRGAEGSRGE